MRVFPLVPLLTAAAAAVAAVPTAAEKTKGVSEALFARFVHFLTISQACYAGDACNLRGLPRVASILNTTTDIHGWVLRDDATREIVVAFRGTSSDVNSRANANYTLGDVETLPQCAGCKAHGGYYVNWVSVFEQVKGLVKDAAAKWPTYGIVVTGHSLGGSMAALCAAHLVTLHQNVTAFTYGEPRTGNAAFAAFLDARFGGASAATTRFFRVSHENDGIVALPGADLGYVHQGVEYWARDPPAAANTYVCGGETLDCAAGAAGDGVNAAHIRYFGIGSGDCPA